MERARAKTNAPGLWHASVKTETPHEQQRRFIESTAKRKIIRAGRRGGKTVGMSILAVEEFKAGKRVLYAAPTQEQIDRFWTEVKRALQGAIDTNALYKNETLHVVEVPGTENRIRAKTAWDADSLRGDYADLLILDEYQLMNEEAWGRVGAPMMLDNNGDAVFIYTPPSLYSRSRTKARDPRHAAKMYKRAEEDDTGRWEAFHFSSHDNPHISTEALEDLTMDMTAQAYDQEIMALDTDEAPGALWTRDLIESTRVARKDVPTLSRLVIGVDPPGGATECGIVAAGLGIDGHAYILEDASLLASAGDWGNAVVEIYHRRMADRVLGEANFGGDMVENTVLKAPDGANVSYEDVRASRGKAVRAQPCAAQYEHLKVHHVGYFPHMEDEMCNWQPDMGMPSPNRLDALVWTITELMLGEQSRAGTWKPSGKR